MADPATDAGRIDRRFDDLDDRLRRTTGLHGLYAAAALLAGLVVPVAEVQLDQAEPVDRYTVIGLVYSLNANVQVDHPVMVAVAATAVTVTTLVAVIAFLLAARRLDRSAATVALVASVLLVPMLLLAGVVFGIIDIKDGSQYLPLQGWGPGFWVLLLASLVGCWIATFLREVFDV